MLHWRGITKSPWSRPRVRRTKDKAKAEVGVQIVQRFILAALCHRTFFSLEEADAAIRQRWRPQQPSLPQTPPCPEIPIRGNRPAGDAPPAGSAIAICGVEQGDGHFDYHIEGDHHFYSVLHRLVPPLPYGDPLPSKSASAENGWRLLREITADQGVNYRSIRSILESNLDSNPLKPQQEPLPLFLQDIALAGLDGRYHRLIAALAKCKVLILDDLLITPLTREDQKELLEILEERYERAATIITSHLPVKA